MHPFGPPETETAALLQCWCGETGAHREGVIDERRRQP